MRFSLALALLLAAAPQGAETLLSRTVPPIVVYTRVLNRYSDVSFEAMKTELAGIMAPSGINFEWRSLDSVGIDEVAVELVVVTLRGTCRGDAPRPPLNRTGPLGWTYITDGDLLPFSDLDCDRIRAFIYADLLGKHAPERDSMLGRAMGRVLAHELYHVFTSSTRHGSDGITKPLFSAAELVSDSFRFRDKESETLRNVKLRSLMRAAYGDSHPSAGQ